MKYSIDELEKILNAKNVNKVHDKKITGIAIDSRKVKPGDLFVPFLGEKVDGHNYIQTAFDNGAVATLSMKEDYKSENNIIYVEDSLTAVQTLAKDYLAKLAAKVVSITGSNGKTTTKDIVAHFLSSKYIVHKTAGNYNNELGVPLTILSAPENTEVLVLEMGADGFGQLDFLSQLAEPDFAIITNIGESHIEFFKDRAGIAKGKFEITNHLKKDGFFIFNGDEPLLTELVEKSEINNISCGQNPQNDIILENYIINNDSTEFKLNTLPSTLTTQLKGKHNLLNIMFAIALSKYFTLTEDDIRKNLADLTKITNMRLESLKYGKDSLIINDAYNASPTSMKAAIDVLEELQGYTAKTIVLGDMFELGPDEVNFHKEVGLYLNNANTINNVISVGSLAKNITSSISNQAINKLHFETTSEVTNYLANNKIKNQVILFKASRGMALETIIKELLESN